MEQKSFEVSNYPACNQVARKKLNTDIDEEIIATFKSHCDVLPLFEAKFFEYTHKRDYSLKNNELLKCRWRDYNARLGNMKKVPFNFPRVDEFHFYNYQNRYEPSQSIINWPHYRKHLRSGPGVDYVGQIPIPDDMQLRKTVMKYIAREKSTDVKRN